MKRAGKVHWMVLIGGLGALVLLAAFFFGGDTPEAGTSRFMTALAKGDVDGIMASTAWEADQEQDLREQWTFATQEAAPYYRFKYELSHKQIPTKGRATVIMKVWRNFEVRSIYDENYSIQLIERDGKWLVEADSIPRSMYPALPR
jgi:hypothetical protein